MTSPTSSVGSSGLQSPLSSPLGSPAEAPEEIPQEMSQSPLEISCPEGAAEVYFLSSWGSV